MSRPMSFERLVETVRYEGAYPTRERAEEVTRGVLAALGRQVTGEERVALAGALPEEAARAFAAELPRVEPLTGWGFVKDYAARTGGSPATARWDVGAVLPAVARLAGPALTERVLDRLPDGYALLFGQPQLAPRRTTLRETVSRDAGSRETVSQETVSQAA
ncbi:DUF2267 domain-containing protein [Streptomyces sp. CC224B]|uniref:DUF2267 domain-containing protein n=1 Tax=Streptomyces sp. CC224B TaxID=3044571 RepID=UPI0032C027CE